MSDLQRTLNTEKKKRGRPSTINIDVINHVAVLIAKGMTEEQACCRVGVNHDSFRTARHRNPDFETAIKRAQAEFLDESLNVIAVGQRGWQGRAWILERRHGAQFKRNLSVEVAEKRPEDMTDEELEALILQGCSPEDLKRIHQLGLAEFLRQKDSADAKR